MKTLFLPISLVSGLLAGQLSKKLFDVIWGRIDDEEAPHPKHHRVDVRKLAIALLIEKATGTWPGEERPEPV
jgi:hypothetical protein